LPRNEGIGASNAFTVHFYRVSIFVGIDIKYHFDNFCCNILRVQALSLQADLLFYSLILEFQLFRSVECYAILQKNEEDRTEFESRILQAIDFFGDGMNVYFDQTSAFIKFIISLELCLTDKWEPQKGLLAERVAIMIREDQQERLEVFEDINRLYQIRSDYVHSGSDQITTSDFSLISYITFGVLIELISWTEKVKTLGELIALFNETKFRCPIIEKDL
jgi:hypothetical protein